MRGAREKLRRTKKKMYTNGLTRDLVKANPTLRRFVCWSSKTKKRCGVSLNGTGNKQSTAQYFKVSMGKNVKFQAHKLELCLKLGILYTDLEGLKQETSHLCHNRLCWRPEHQNNEHHKANSLRNNGVGCGGFTFDPEMRRLVCYCTHNPPCAFVRVPATDHPP